MWFKSLTLATLIVLAGISGPAYAQKKNKVVAKVNGIVVTAADVEIFKSENGDYLSRFPAELRYQKTIGRLIDIALLAKAAIDAKIHETNSFKFRRTYYERKALSDSFVQTKIFPKVTDARVKARYDNLVANAPKADEVRIRHILVKSKSEAEAVIAELKKGVDFAEYARVKSTGPSAKLGGDLGYITEIYREQNIAKVAFKLKKGEVSAPVQTKLGWHVLKLEDRRRRQLQEYKNIKVRLKNVVLRNELNDNINGLRKTAKIEYIDPKGKPKKGK